MISLTHNLKYAFRKYPKIQNDLTDPGVIINIRIEVRESINTILRFNLVIPMLLGLAKQGVGRIIL